VLWPNALGLLLGLFYTLSAYALADSKTRDRQVAILLLFSTVFLVVGSVGTMGDMGDGGRKTLWGFTSNGGHALRAGPCAAAWRLHAHPPVTPAQAPCGASKCAAVPPALPTLPQASCSYSTPPRCPRCWRCCAHAAQPPSTCRCL
jgi:hypothetical protein